MISRQFCHIAWANPLLAEKAGSKGRLYTQAHGFDDLIGHAEFDCVSDVIHRYRGFTNGLLCKSSESNIIQWTAELDFLYQFFDTLDT